MDERTRENLTRGREHYAAAEYDKAEPFLVEIANGNFDFADVYDMLGVIYHQQGRLGDAESMFQRALAINPNYTDAALNLAVTYNDLGKYADAKRIYAQAMSASKTAVKHLDPFARGKIANMHADVGGAYHGVGQFLDAVREYERALTLCPTFHDIRTRLGTTLRDMGNFVAAAHEFERVRHDSPQYVPARVNLGLTYYSMGRRADALSEWQQILGLDPTNKSAAMYIAMVSQMPDAGSSSAAARLPADETPVAAEATNKASKASKLSSAKPTKPK